MSEIDAKAKICPHCAKKQNKIPVVGRIVIAVIVFFVLIGLFSDSNSENNIPEEEKFTISDVKAYSDDSGFAYYIEGIVKNNTDKDYNYIQITYNVYDKDDNNLGTCLDNNSNLKSGETWKFKTMCSGSPDEIVRYELDEITSY